MTFEEAQLAIEERTTKEVQSKIVIMLDQYKQAETEIIDELNKVYAKFLNTTDPADYYNIIIQKDRLTNLLNTVREQYVYYAKIAGEDIAGISATAMQSTYYQQLYLVSWGNVGSTALSFSILDPVLIELSVEGTIAAWKKYKDEIPQNFAPQYGTLKELLKTRSAEDLAKIQQVITQAFIQGKSIDAMSADILDFFNTAKFKAERIARTEATRTANAGALAAAQEAVNAGINTEKMWLATLDSKVRPVHAALDGQIAEVDQPFHSEAGDVMYPGMFASVGQNVNCRCTVAYLPNGMRPAARTGRNPVIQAKIEAGETNPATGKPYKNGDEIETFTFKDYAQWKKDIEAQK